MKKIPIMLRVNMLTWKLYQNKGKNSSADSSILWPFLLSLPHPLLFTDKSVMINKLVFALGIQVILRKIESPFM